jgi:hypothetical protein
MSVSVVNVLSDWSIDGHFSSSLELVQVSGQLSTLEITISSVEFDQDINITFLVNHGDWGIWLLDLISFEVFTTKSSQYLQKLRLMLTKF